MSETTEVRPAPRDAIRQAMTNCQVPSADYAATIALAALAEAGYVIVHPDDVPNIVARSEWESGWNRCRAEVFG